MIIFFIFLLMFHKTLELSFFNHSVNGKVIILVWIHISSWDLVVLKDDSYTSLLILFFQSLICHCDRIFRDIKKHLKESWCIFLQRMWTYDYFFHVPSGCFTKPLNKVFLNHSVNQNNNKRDRIIFFHLYCIY